MEDVAGDLGRCRTRLRERHCTAGDFIVYLFIEASQVVLVIKKKKNLPANAGDIRDVGSTPGLRRSPAGGHGTHSSILAWRIPWTEEPGGLHSELQRFGHD